MRILAERMMRDGGRRYTRPGESSMYEKYSRLIVHLIGKASLPPDLDPEDLSQETWARLLAGGFDPDATGAKSYIGRVVRSVISDALAGRGGTVPLTDAGRCDPEPLDLDEGDRILLEARYVEKRSLPELAAMYGVSRERIQFLLKQAKKRARYEK